MALTMKHADGESSVMPWAIDYKTFNNPDNNAFFKAAPQLRHGG